jgi:hypothetical protein
MNLPVSIVSCIVQKKNLVQVATKDRSLLKYKFTASRAGGRIALKRAIYNEDNNL